MKRLVLTLTLTMGAACSLWAARTAPWSKEKAWAWYNAQPWMRGCNYLPASAANYADMWQELGSEERFKEMEKEFALAQKTGFNVMRLIIHEQGFGIWLADHDGFMARFERWLQLLDQYGMRAIILLGNDCSRPKEMWQMPKPGVQKYDWGYHGGRKKTQHGSFKNAVGYTILDEPTLRPKFYEMCGELLTKYRTDRRVAFWNLWNEPGNNNRGPMTMSHMRQLFDLAWKIDPIQPLAADIWGDGYGMGLPKGAKPDARREAREAVQKMAGELSDIISYHCYGPYPNQVKLIRDLKRYYGRPLVNTEWLARIKGCNVTDCYPLFYIEKVGAVNWGLVAGKYQTYEPYEPMWATIEKGGGQDWDMTKWYHDLFRPSHHPYDPKELRIIKRFNALADEDFAIDQARVTKEK